MKKLSILFAGLFIASAMFTSCDKDEPTTDSNPIGTATITGYVYMLTDATTNTSLVPDVPAYTQFAPAGTQVILKIDADDLVQDQTNTVNYPEKSYFATVGSDGKYTFTVDAGAKAVNITMLQAVDIEANYIRNSFGGGALHDTTSAYHWTCNNVIGNTLVEKQLVYQNLTYAGVPVH